MKIKKQITLVILMTGLLVTGIVYADDPLKTSGGDSTGSGTGMGWQEQTQRTTIFISDGLRITTGPGIGTAGLTWSIGVSSNFNFIECCRPATLKQSWCNYNADDERCRN